MTEYAHELVRRLEAGFAGKRLTVALRAEYVVFLEGVGTDTAERAVTTALRTLKYRPTIFELAQICGSIGAHPATPPKPLAPDDPRLERSGVTALELDYAGVPDEFRPLEVDRPASPEYAAYWRGRIRETLAGGAGPLDLRLPELERDDELDPLLDELEPDELDRDDLEPF